MNTKPADVQPISAEPCRGPRPSSHGLRLPVSRLLAAILFMAGSLSCSFWTCCSPAEEAGAAKQPSFAEEQYKTLDPFYEQHIIADGVLFVGSEKVTKWALNEAVYLARKMLANRPDVMKKFGNTNKAYVCVMAYSEMQTDLPECRGMDMWWNYRARGLAGRPVSCGEENLLAYPGDPWAGENIFVHEFAHGIHGIIAGFDENFNARFNALFEKAKESGRFRGYAIEGGPGEFFAEGVQAWFNCNRGVRPKCGGGQSSFEVLGPDGEHVCYLTTREEVKTHMPEYAKLLDESFRQNEWVYVPAARRLHEPHLRGFDPAKAPTFRFPPEAVKAYEAYKRAEAKKAKEEEQREKEAEERKSRAAPKEK